MSYDYMLAKGDASGGIDGFSEAAAMGVIGSAESIMALISSLFPTMKWMHIQVNVPEHGLVSSWRGLQGPPEVSFLVEQTKQVRVLTMSYCERIEVELVAKELGLVAFDMQSLEVFDA